MFAAHSLISKRFSDCWLSLQSLNYYSISVLENLWYAKAHGCANGTALCCQNVFLNRECKLLNRGQSGMDTTPHLQPNLHLQVPLRSLLSAAGVGLPLAGQWANWCMDEVSPTAESGWAWAARAHGVTARGEPATPKLLSTASTLSLETNLSLFTLFDAADGVGGYKLVVLLNSRFSRFNSVS